MVPFSSATAPLYGPCVFGLQLIGVYAIVLYHIWPSEFGNGFMGVDILFVIFGFVIGVELIELSDKEEHTNSDQNNSTTLPSQKTTLLNWAKSLAKFVHQIRRFYARKLTYFVSSNLLLILGSLIGAFAFFLDDTIEQLRNDIMWALCFGTNHQMTDVDWTLELIGISQPRPLLHLWAVSVQLQFLLALSSPLLFLFKFSSKLFWRRPMNCLLVQLSALFVLLVVPSFLFWRFASSNSVAMGWLLARAWQFLLGTMSARIAIPHREQMQKCQQIKASEVSSPSLFSMVAEHCLFYSVAFCLGVVFFLPSIFWPPFFHLKSLLTISVCSITAFLLCFFTGRLKKSLPPSALSRWLFLHFGQFPLICFLLHRPLAVFFRAFLTVSQLTIFDGFLAILLITFCSFVVHLIFLFLFAVFPPKKCRFSLFAYALLFAYAFCFLFAIAPGSIRFGQKQQNELAIPIYDESQHKVQLLPLSVPSVRTFLEQIGTKDYRNELSPLLNTVEKVKINEMLKNSFTFDLNNVPGESSDDFVREINMLEDNKHVKRIHEWMMKGNGTRRVLLFGNSHAQVAWREVAEAFKGDFRWLRVVSVPGCMPLFENDWRTIYGVRCAETVKGMVKMLRKTRPDLLFLIFRWYDDFQPTQNEKINLGEDAELEAMQSLMNKVQKLVEKRIFISAPNLQFDTEISHQLAKRIWQNTPLEGLNKNYSEHLEENRIHYDRLGRLRCAKCSVFDLAEDFCWEGICHAFEPNTKLAYFSDKNHLSFLGRLKAKKTFEKLAKSVAEKGAEKR
ncbi:hypothetical protein niasHS_010570 [Heterodera schachtii]|uniref:SGNH domain-containing protein n=1 Tax=Heterodera schachtii TaxID=97005 RepID=A0ABD2IT68_HETSC